MRSSTDYIKTFNRNRLFWILNILGWLGISFLIFIYDNSELASFYYYYAVYTFYLLGFAVSILLRYYLRNRIKQFSSILRVIVFILAITVISSALVFILHTIICIPYFISLKLPLSAQLPHISDYLTKTILSAHVLIITLVICAWSTLYIGFRFWLDLTEEKKRIEKVNLQAQEARLQMLRYQINPHFLFNSLNSIQALMNHDIKVADRMLAQLSDFLRYSLISDDRIYVPLKRELEIIEKYISIEEVRFGRKLEYNIEYSSEAHEIEILCFILQPLVENAIKHGFKTSPKKLFVLVTATTVDSWLVISIRNSGRWYEPGNNSGRGIKNVRERLDNAYRDDYRFSVSEEGGWVNVVLKIKIADEKTEGIHS